MDKEESDSDDSVVAAERDFRKCYAKIMADLKNGGAKPARKNLFGQEPVKKIYLRPSMIDRACLKTPFTSSTPMPTGKKKLFMPDNSGTVSPINDAANQENIDSPIRVSQTENADSVVTSSSQDDNQISNEKTVSIPKKSNTKTKCLESYIAKINNRKSQAVQTINTSDKNVQTSRHSSGNVLPIGKSLRPLTGSSRSTSSNGSYTQNLIHNLDNFQNVSQCRISVNEEGRWRLPSIIYNNVQLDPQHTINDPAEDEESDLDDTFRPKPPKSRKVFTNKKKSKEVKRKSNSRKVLESKTKQHNISVNTDPVEENVANSTKKITRNSKIINEDNQNITNLTKNKKRNKVEENNHGDQSRANLTKTNRNNNKSQLEVGMGDQHHANLTKTNRNNKRNNNSQLEVGRDDQHHANLTNRNRNNKRNNNNSGVDSQTSVAQSTRFGRLLHRQNTDASQQVEPKKITNSVKNKAVESKKTKNSGKNKVLESRKTQSYVDENNEPPEIPNRDDSSFDSHASQVEKIQGSRPSPVKNSKKKVAPADHFVDEVVTEPIEAPGSPIRELLAVSAVREKSPTKNQPKQVAPQAGLSTFKKPAEIKKKSSGSRTTVKTTKSIRNLESDEGISEEAPIRRSTRERQQAPVRLACTIVCRKKSDRLFKEFGDVPGSQKNLSTLNKKAKSSKRVTSVANTVPPIEETNDVSVPIVEEPIEAPSTIARRTTVNLESPAKQKRILSGRISKKSNRKTNEKNIRRAVESLDDDQINFLNYSLNGRVIKKKWTVPKFKFEEIKSLSGVFAATEEGFSGGYLTLKGGKTKPKQMVNCCQMMFCVLQGQAQIGVQDKCIVLKKSGMFVVPPGCEYYIKNLHNRNDLILTFTRMAPEIEA